MASYVSCFVRTRVDANKLVRGGGGGEGGGRGIAFDGGRQNEKIVA